MNGQEILDALRSQTPEEYAANKPRLREVFGGFEIGWPAVHHDGVWFHGYLGGGSTAGNRKICAIEFHAEPDCEVFCPDIPGFDEPKITRINQILRNGMIRRLYQPVQTDLFDLLGAA